MGNRTEQDRIALFVPTMTIGGAERVALNLVRGMVAARQPVDLVLSTAQGGLLPQIPNHVPVVDLAASRLLRALPNLVRYMRRERPAAMISHMRGANIVAVVARRLARVPCRLLIVEHTSRDKAQSFTLQDRAIMALRPRVYPSADAVVAVSAGLASILRSCGLTNVHTIYNPVVDDALIAQADQPIDHPWLQPDQPPVFLSVGRLVVPKDYPTLIKAFSIVRRQSQCRLLILGEGDQRPVLEQCARDAGLTADDFEMPGFQANPYPYMRRAHAFVLSSIFEGFAMALVEALACGTRVISTDCRSGPSEILECGKYGALVPPGNAESLACAMLDSLITPCDKTRLEHRARDFSVEAATSAYLRLALHR